MQVIDKERMYDALFDSVKSTELEIVEKDNLMVSLNERLFECRSKLQEREHQLRELRVAAQRMEESIQEKEQMLTSYGGILKAKENTLHAKEQLAYHFFDLITQTDEKIRLNDEEVTKLFSELQRPTEDDDDNADAANMEDSVLDPEPFEQQMKQQRQPLPTPSLLTESIIEDYELVQATMQ